jgi:ABC-type transport system involved in multi-copper enzyme maturation permease subunit
MRPSMTWNIFRFEVRYWLRGMMVWIFLVVIGALVFAAASSDKVNVGTSIENTYRNAPYAVQTFYSILSLLTLLMTTAFVNGAAARDFQYGTHPLLFSTPLRKLEFLLGRYFGAAFVSLIPMLGVSLGVILAAYMPWIDAERWGPIVWAAHGKSILSFAIPNALFVSSIIFCIAALTRSTVTSFLGSLLLLVGYTVAEGMTEDLDNETIGMLLDPFGIRAFSLMTKYWTVAERNSLALGLEGMMFWNRLLWLTVAAGIFAFTAWRFSFADREGKSKTVLAATVASGPAALPAVQYNHGAGAGWVRLHRLLAFEFLGLVKTTSFIVLLAAAVLNTVPAIILAAKEGYGNSSYPVTYWLLDLIQGSLYLFIVSMITYYAGMLAWRERDMRMDEIEDATPHLSWIRYLAKVGALLAVMALLQGLMMFTGMAVQTAFGYYRYQPELYLSELFLYDFSLFVFLVVLAFFIHVLAPNKYIGYFAFVIFLIANSTMWGPLNVATRLVRYASRPDSTYSDFYGHAPFLAGWWWFTAYWAAWALLLSTASSALWPRGKETSLRKRLTNIHTGLRMRTAGIGALVLALGGWLYWNTTILNELIGPETALDIRADYERTYKKIQNIPQPRITRILYDIEIYPERRAVVFQADQEIVNKHSVPIVELHLVTERTFRYNIAIEGAKLRQEDTRLQYRIYSFDPPMKPGESRRMRFTVSREPHGIENSVSSLSIVQNGTFFNNTIAPQIGYQPDNELTLRNDRKKRGLPEKEQMPKLERNCTSSCMNTYLSNNSDWVSVESRISTSAGQIAIAPGSLMKEWTEGGRRHFHYKLDRDSMNFYSFMSARYAVAREQWNGIHTEVYYHAEHTWNVPKMMKSLQKSLEYYTASFGPYAHKQARIIEFPRIASFAQAFPGTMPYSESIGFIANMEKPDDIDMVFYVVAHEMAHQWWAHQLSSANMQGATTLTEMLAQYSALMVMEKEYGRDMMRKFLEYEIDGYLRARGRELIKERPLLTVEASQGYIHYRKGSAVMYYLKEMIGEEAVNRALRNLLARFAYAEPPYPTSHDLLDALREVTPENLRYLLKDLFEEITLFGNRTERATATRRPDGKFEVTIDIETRKLKADEKGNEIEVPGDDFIEIGAFAKPAEGQRYGKTLYRSRIRMKSGKGQYTFLVDQEPDKAGIDPFRLLIDRLPDDNVKTVTIGE